MKNFLLTIIFIILFALLWKYVGEPNNRAYNAHVCAVYGYEPDCKTPLPADRRLK